RRGFPDFTAPLSNENHLLDDRSAVHWLMAERKASDVLMTTHLALPALWWYGGLDISRLLAGGGGLFSPFEGRYVSPGESCQPNALREALQGYERVLLYLGFRFDDVPRGFDDLVVEHLKELGVVEASRRFANWSRAVIVDLRAPAGTTGVASPV